MYFTSITRTAFYFCSAIKSFCPVYNIRNANAVSFAVYIKAISIIFNLYNNVIAFGF